MIFLLGPALILGPTSPVRSFAYIFSPFAFSISIHVKNKSAGFLPPGQAVLLQAFSGHEGAGFLGGAHNQSPYYYIQLSAYYSFDGFRCAGLRERLIAWKLLWSIDGLVG